MTRADFELNKSCNRPKPTRPDPGVLLRAPCSLPHTYVYGRGSVTAEEESFASVVCFPYRLQSCKNFLTGEKGTG